MSITATLTPCVREHGRVAELRAGEQLHHDLERASAKGELLSATRRLADAPTLYFLLEVQLLAPQVDKELPEREANLGGHGVIETDDV